MTTTQPAGSRGAARSAQESPQACLPVASDQPTLIRIRYPVQPLMHAPAVVPADEFIQYTAKMPFIPDQHSVETLPTKRPYQPLDVRRRVGRAIRNRYPPNPHLLPEPHIVCGSTRDLLPCILHWKPKNRADRTSRRCRGAGTWAAPRSRRS